MSSAFLIMKYTWPRSSVIFTVLATFLAASFIRETQLLPAAVEDLTVSSELHESRQTVPVFFNVYLKPDADEHETNRVQALVHGQLSHLIPDIHGPIFVRTIGKELAIPNTTHLGHDLQGNEERTLHSLWEYCKMHPNQDAVYLHSKGSFSNNRQNELFREFLTRTALSTDCTRAIQPDNEIQCNVCGARFSPMPHPHVPGNMFIAKCSYVAKLIDPLDFQAMMDTVPHLANRKYPNYEVGQDKFAAEHWIGSRGPSLRPCDMYNLPSYTFGYDNIPDLRQVNESEPLPPTMFELQPAPRFRFEVWPLPYSMKHRWLEYLFLYNETPPLPESESLNSGNGTRMLSDIWWGWRLQPWVDEALAWNRIPPSI